MQDKAVILGEIVAEGGVTCG